jgi:surface protein
MKTRQRLLAMLLMMLFMGTKMMAATKEAYAVYVASSKTLTFYYDTQKGTRPGTPYSLNTGEDDPEWYDENNTVEVLKVVFHSSFKDARPTSTYAWFANKTTLTSIVDIKYLNTSEVTNMANMFTGCDNLTDIDVTGFDTSKVTDMSRMFSWTGIKEIDVSNFNTSRVTKMTSMFALTDLVTLDLSNFDTRKVVDMRLMFFGNPDLTTIYVGGLWSTASLPEEYDEMDWMFRSCDNLKGGAGTKFDEKHDGKEYAHIDGGKSNPGYLSVLKYDLNIAGTQVTYANKNDILGNGIFAYEPESKTLTINGIYRTEYSPIIRSSIDGLIIQGGLTADLSLKNNGTIIALYNNTTIKSDGLLILESDDKNSNEVYAIDVYSGNLTINNVDNMVIMSMCGIVSTSYNGKLTIKSSNIIFKCEQPENSSQAAMAVYGLDSGIILQGSRIYTADVHISDGGLVDGKGMPATSVNIVRDNSISTNLNQVTSDAPQVTSDEWYTIDGRKLNGMPAKKGIYIHNGKKGVVH